MPYRSREPVRVAAVFTPGELPRPVWFERGRRRHQVRATTYTWQERVGSTLLLRFAVSDGADLFELTYDTAAQNWQLTAVETGAG